MRRTSLGTLVCVALLIAACAGGPPPRAELESVLRAREQALIARDLETILDLFADDAVVTTSTGRKLTVKDQIRVWVKDQIDRNQREEASPRQHDGNKLSWSARVYRDDWNKLGVSPLDAVQDAVIEDGKIKAFNTRLTPVSAAKLEAAPNK
jgi:hypothetical protein